MASFTNSLKWVRIAAPCNADWDRMFSFSDDRVRFCSQCNKNVYNLSEMTRSEAEALINYTEGRICVRFYQRSDGTILTQNCPVGLKAIKRKAAWVAQLLLGMGLSLLYCLGLYGLVLEIKLRINQPSQHRMGALARLPEPVPTPDEKQVQEVMGELAKMPLPKVRMGKVIRRENRETLKKDQ